MGSGEGVHSRSRRLRCKVTRRDAVHGEASEAARDAAIRALNPTAHDVTAFSQRGHGFSVACLRDPAIR